MPEADFWKELGWWYVPVMGVVFIAGVYFLFRRQGFNPTGPRRHLRHKPEWRVGPPRDQVYWNRGYDKIAELSRGHATTGEP